MQSYSRLKNTSATNTHGGSLYRQCRGRGECQQPMSRVLENVPWNTRVGLLTFTPGLPVRLPLRLVMAPLILSPIVGLRDVAMPLLREVVAGPWAPVPRTPALLEDKGPLPAWPWWPMPPGCVVVFLVVVVLPVMGLVEVDSVTRAFCVVFLPARRDKRPGLRPVEVVGAVVVRVRAMRGYEGSVWSSVCLDA